MKNNQVHLRLMFAVLIAFAIPASAFAYGPALQPGTVFDGITGTFKSSAAGWMGSAQGYAQHLFFGLAGIEFTWAAAQLLLKKGELNDMIASVFLKVLGIGFFYSLLMMAPTWVPQIMDSFAQAGSSVGAGGGSAAMLSPSGIFDRGISVASAMVDAMNKSNSGNVSLTSVVSSGGASIGSFLFGAIVTGLSGLMTIIAFTLVAVQLMVTLIESYIVIGGGMLMLGFLGSRWTLPFGEKYFGYAVSTGIKLFTLYLIVGQGATVANQIIHALNSGGTAPGPVDFLGAGASSLAYGAMGFMVPALAGSMMNGSPSLSMGNMMSAGGGIAGSMVGAAAMIGSAALSGASAAMGAFNKTTKAAGNIGGEMTPGGGGIGGDLLGKTGSQGVDQGGSGANTGFGGGISSPVAAPPGLSGGGSDTSIASSLSSPTQQPTPAPAAMADAGSMPAATAGSSTADASTQPVSATTTESKVSATGNGMAKAAADAKPATTSNASTSNYANNVSTPENAPPKRAADVQATPTSINRDRTMQPQSAPAQVANAVATPAQSKVSATGNGMAKAAADEKPETTSNASTSNYAKNVSTPENAPPKRAADVQATPTSFNSDMTTQPQSAPAQVANAVATPAQGKVSATGNGVAKAAADVKPVTMSSAGTGNYAKNVSAPENVSSKGGTDAVVDKRKTGIDLAKRADSLNEMARRMDRLPVNDGHTGGISIRLNHLE